VVQTEVEVATLPRRTSGGSLLLAASFISRLLNKELELKGCQASDVSNAQPDLKHLSVEQLLVIRVRTLEFTAVGGGSHSAHANFLSTLDSHLLEKLGRHSLRDSEPTSTKVSAFRYAGYRLVLVVGAIQALKDGWDSMSPRASLQRGDVPLCWAFELEREEWPDSSVMIVHAAALRVEAASALPDEVRMMISSEQGQLALVADGSAVNGNDRLLHWDVAVLSLDRDLVAELRRSDKGKEPSVRQKKLTHELSKVLDERNRAFPEKAHLPKPAQQEAAQDDAAPRLPNRCVSLPADFGAALGGVHHGGLYSGVLSSARDRQNQPKRVVSLGKLASGSATATPQMSPREEESIAEEEPPSSEAPPAVSQPEAQPPQADPNLAATGQHINGDAGTVEEIPEVEPVNDPTVTDSAAKDLEQAEDASASPAAKEEEVVQATEAETQAQPSAVAEASGLERNSSPMSAEEEFTKGLHEDVATGNLPAPNGKVNNLAARRQPPPVLWSPPSERPKAETNASTSARSSESTWAGSWSWLVGTTPREEELRQAEESAFREKRGGCCGVGASDLCGDGREDILVDERRTPSMVHQQKFSYNPHHGCDDVDEWQRSKPMLTHGVL